MPRLAAALLPLLLAAHAFAQAQPPRPGGDDAANAASLKRLTLISDLQFLASDALNLDRPLARSLAQAEIADAAWALDEAWAKKLLREAYKLTMPPEDEQKRLRGLPAGSPPIFSSGSNRARGTVRQRIFEIARRDPAFAAELSSLAGQKLGIHEEQSAYVTLAGRAAAAGDVATAGDYARRAMQLDPSRIDPAFVINEIARGDRAAADALILQYFELLRGFPVSRDDQSSTRTMFAMGLLTNPSSFANVAKKDQACALRLVTQAVAQLKRADTTIPPPPPGIPASAIADGKEFDPVLMGLSRLAKLILPVDESLGREAIGEMIAAANRSELDTEQGRMGFEPDVFKIFAARNEAESVTAAQTLKNRVQRIAALASAYKGAAEKLTRKPNG